MIFDFDVEHRRRALMQEAEQRRLVRVAQQGRTADPLLIQGAEVLGRQLIRLGMSLRRTLQAPVIQPESAACCSPA